MAATSISGREFNEVVACEQGRSIRTGAAGTSATHSHAADGIALSRLLTLSADQQNAPRPCSE
jgi:hypothetical protein